MKTFRASVVKNITKLDYIKYKELCSLYQDTHPHLFNNDKYTVFERQHVGISAFLHANDSADELFSVILTLTYNNHSNIKKEVLYGKRFPSGHNSYLSSVFSYEFRSRRIGTHNTATPG